MIELILEMFCVMVSDELRQRRAERTTGAARSYCSDDYCEQAPPDATMPPIAEKAAR